MTALALEDGMFAHAYLDVQIARGTAVAPRFALAVQANTVPRIDARRHRHRQSFLLPHAALAETGIGDDLAATLAPGAGLLNREDGLLNADLTLAITGIASLGGRPFGGARAL